MRKFLLYIIISNFISINAIATNIKIEDRIITNYKFSRLCPIETPERSHIGIVNSPRFNGQLRIDCQFNDILNCNQNKWFIFKLKRVETKMVIRFQIINHYKSWKKLLISKFIRTVNILNQIQFKNFFTYKNLIIKNFIKIFYSYFVTMNVGPEYKFSFSTNITPFLKYNDRIRIMIGANIIRQALSRIKVYSTCMSFQYEILIW